MAALNLVQGSHKTRHGAVAAPEMSKQAIGNVLAGMAFLIVAIVDFTRESSGIGAVFVVFAAVFLGLGLSGKKQR
jgi:uncharacterized membrane protein